MTMSIKNIVVSVAGVAESLITARYSIYLANLLNAKLTAIYVVDENALTELVHSHIFVEVEAQDYERDLQEQGKRFLERLNKMCQKKNVAFEGVLLRGVIHDEVTNKTKDIDADLLVMGELKEVLSRKEIFYDEGERIFREAPCPVVIVKNPERVQELYDDLPDM